MQTCIMGIDPGLAHCGWGLITINKQSLCLLACGEITSKANQALSQRLQQIHQGLTEIFTQYQASACAVEEVYMNKNATSAIPVAHARGVALLCAAQHGITVQEFSANRIKQAVTGNGKAAKIQVQEMVALLLGLQFGGQAPAIRSDHAADALAAAICMFHQNGNKIHALENISKKSSDFWENDKEADKNAEQKFQRLIQQQK